MSLVSVELGFVEKERAPWKLLSKFFPSKVGGFPAWLRLNNTPNRSDITCSSCNKPLIFLMQVYAPISDIETAFHRTLFVFMCPSEKCNKRFNSENFVVLRSQLPRRNEFYSFSPPEYNKLSAKEPSASQFGTLCCVCGCSGAVKCKSCEIFYCCESHRSFDWESGHQGTCGKENPESKYKNVINQFVLPEFELVTEAEELPLSVPEKSDEEKLKDFAQFMQSSKAPKELQDVPMEDFDNVMKKKDKAFNKFKKRIQQEPEQVLRYQRGGEPLWLSSEHVPSTTDIPKCNCGAERIFEFQVMPQMLIHLSLDSIDWGTLVVYTCSVSCENATQNYVNEIMWKQDISEDHEK